MDIDLQGKVAFIVADEQGPGMDIARDFAGKGADIALIFSAKGPYTEKARQDVITLGRRCLLLYGNASEPGFLEKAKASVMQQLGRLDVLVTESGRVFVIPTSEGLSQQP